MHANLCEHAAADGVITRSLFGTCPATLWPYTIASLSWLEQQTKFAKARVNHRWMEMK